jgi:hypothetical protein
MTVIDNVTREQAPTTAERRHPDRRCDERGIVIGPWSDSVKRANMLLRSVRRTVPREYPYRTRGGGDFVSPPPVTP